jgi:hypothetical protein
VQESSRAAPEALGRTRVLWDWSDQRADRWKDALSGGAAPRTELYLEDAYKDHDKDALPASQLSEGFRRQTRRRFGSRFSLQ